MEGFQYSVMYRSGDQNIADYMSRQFGTMAVTTRSKDADRRPDYAALNKGIIMSKPMRGANQQPNSQHSTEKANSTVRADQQIPQQVSKGSSASTTSQNTESITASRGPVSPNGTVTDCHELSPKRDEDEDESPEHKATERLIREGDSLSQRPNDVLRQDKVNSDVPSIRDELKEGSNVKYHCVSKTESNATSERPNVEQPIPGLINTEVLKKEQKDDIYIQRIWSIAHGIGVEDATTLELQDAYGIGEVAGIIVKATGTPTQETVYRVVVPQSLQRQVTTYIHKLTHSGIEGTYKALQREHWFRGMKQIVKEVVSNCPDCIAVKGRPRMAETLAPDKRPATLGDRWHLDGLQLPPSSQFDHLIVATDFATKYVILTKSTGESAQAAVDALMEIVSRFGPPKRVVTDRGRAFMSNLFITTCRDLGVQFDPVGIHRAQSNGMAERTNRTLLEVIITLCRGQGERWASHVKEIEYVMNTRISSVTKFSPYELVYGRQPPGPRYTAPIREAQMDGIGEGELLDQLRRRISLLEELAHQNQIIAGQQQMSYHDAHAKAHVFQLGDKVYLYRASTTPKSTTTKLLYRWKGPYVITTVIGHNAYTLADENGIPLAGTYHADNLFKVESKPSPEGRQV